MTSEFIAGSVNTNPVVVRRILSMLSRAGLVDTQEGAGGGGQLAKPAADIDLRAVYAAVEADPLFALHRRDPNPLCPVGGTIQAALSPTLGAAEGAMLGSLAKTTVADLLSRVRP